MTYLNQPSPTKPAVRHRSIPRRISSCRAGPCNACLAAPVPSRPACPDQNSRRQTSPAKSHQTVPRPVFPCPACHAIPRRIITRRSGAVPASPAIPRHTAARRAIPNIACLAKQHHVRSIRAPSCNTCHSLPATPVLSASRRTCRTTRNQTGPGVARPSPPNYAA